MRITSLFFVLFLLALGLARTNTSLGGCLEKCGRFSTTNKKLGCYNCCNLLVAVNRLGGNSDCKNAYNRAS